MNSVTVVIEDLPMRPEKLSQYELEGVFGGCKKEGYSCKKSKDCCDGLKCMGHILNLKYDSFEVGKLHSLEASHFTGVVCY